MARSTRPRLVRRTLAVAAVSPVLVGGLAACGSDDGSDSTAHDPVIGAALLSDLDSGDQVDPDDFVDTVTDGIEQSTTAHMTMNMSIGSAGSVDAQGDVDYTSKPPSTKMTMTIPGAGDSTVISTDGVMYLQMGGLSGGKYWKVDPSDPDSPLGQMGLGSMLDQSDPASALESIKPSIDEVTFKGDEQVDGRDLDHYVMTIDLGTMMDSMGADLPSEAASGMPDSVTYDLWLDQQNRFAQMKSEYPVMGQQISMTINVDDWGTDVSIEAPPADQVTDMPDFGSMMTPPTAKG